MPELRALAEHLRGVGQGVENLVYVGVDDPGVGGEIPIVDGRGLRGARGYAGEFGHMLVNPDGVLCRCGNVGCWETEDLHAANSRGVGAGGERHGRRRSRPGPGRGAGRGPADRRTLSRRGLAGIANALNTEMIVFGGTLRDVYPVVQREADAAFLRLVLPAPRASVRLAMSRLGPDAASVGAAEMVFEALFDDPEEVVSAAPGPAARAPLRPCHR